MKSSWIRAGAASGIERLVLAATGVLAIAAAAGCGGGVPKIGEKPVKNVHTVENNVDGLRVWAARRARAEVLVHIDSADDIAIFGPALIDSVENVARRLRRGDVMALGTISPLIERGGVVTIGYMAGMYKRIVWVIPTAVSAADESPDTYRRFFIERRKLPPASIGEFRVEGKAVTGTIAGIPLTIVRLEDLSLGEGETAIVDIDLNYFQLRGAGDPEYRHGTGALFGFLRALAAADIRTRLVTVNCANQSNEVPLDLRYYGAVIAETLAKPKLLEPPLSGKYDAMIQAEDSLRAGNYAAAAAIYRSELAGGEKSAGLQFALAVALGFDGKGVESREALLEAYRLDHEYLRGFSQLARVLGASQRIETGVEILDSPELVKIIGRSELEYQKGVFFFAAKRPYDALLYLRGVAPYRPNDFGLYTIIFRACREVGDSIGERSALQRLVTIDEGRVRREMPWVFADLGRLYEETGFRRNAVEMYGKYVEVVPDDSLASVLRGKLDSWKAAPAAR